MILHPPRSTRFPYTTLFRSARSTQQMDVIPLAVGKNFKPRDRFDKKFLERTVEKYGLPPRYLLFVGRLNRRKNIHGLIRSEEHTSELQSLTNLVCRLLLEKK